MFYTDVELQLHLVSCGRLEHLRSCIENDRVNLHVTKRVRLSRLTLRLLFVCIVSL